MHQSVTWQFLETCGITKCLEQSRNQYLEFARLFAADIAHVNDYNKPLGKSNNNNNNNDKINHENMLK